MSGKPLSQFPHAHRSKPAPASVAECGSNPQLVPLILAGPRKRRNHMRRISREGECRRLYLLHLHNGWRLRRDGKLYKSWWATKPQTNRIAKAKPRNRASFYRVDNGPIRGEWQGIISHDGVLMIVKVEISPSGSSKITVTKEN